MSQNGATAPTDENRAPTSLAPSLNYSLFSIYVPNGNHNTAGQAYYPSTIYSDPSAYSSINNVYRSIGNGFVYYPPYFPPQTNILAPLTYVPNSTTLLPRRSGIPQPLLSIPSGVQPSDESSIREIEDSERNTNLNIRECHSPIVNKTKRKKKSLVIVDPINRNKSISIQQAPSSTSSPVFNNNADHLRSHSSNSNLIIGQDIIDSNNSSDDFLTFIEPNIETTTPSMPELNPFANEFSFNNNKTLTNDSSVTTNDTINENQSSYRLLFDNLIEKSLESIEAIKKTTKKIPVNDVSVQCNPIKDNINRSTQTIAKRDNSDFIEEYSLRTIKLMDKLVEDFRNVYQNELHNQCKTMAHTCDELRALILFIHHIISSSSSDDEKRKQATIDLDNRFSNIIQDFENDMINGNKYEISAPVINSVGRGTRHFLPTMSNSLLPSFSCRQIDPMTPVTSKICLLCKKPLHEANDVMHKLCRSFSSRPNMYTDT